jgi:hypothetical protein
MMNATLVKIRAKIVAAKKRLRAIVRPTITSNYSADDGFGAESVL